MLKTSTIKHHQIYIYIYIYISLNIMLKKNVNKQFIDDNNFAGCYNLRDYWHHNWLNHQASPRISQRRHLMDACDRVGPALGPDSSESRDCLVWQGRGGMEHNLRAVFSGHYSRWIYYHLLNMELNVCICMCMHTYIYIYIWMCVCKTKYIYIYIYVCV